MKKVKIVINGELPALNEIIDASKGHWGQYSKMKKFYTSVVRKAVESLPSIEKADFEITWFCKNKRKDKDNIMGGQKFIFDGLVDAGVLKNDGWSQIGDISHLFEVDKANPRIEVEIILEK